MCKTLVDIQWMSPKIFEVALTNWLVICVIVVIYKQTQISRTNMFY